MQKIPVLTFYRYGLWLY